MLMAAHLLIHLNIRCLHQQPANRAVRHSHGCLLPATESHINRSRMDIQKLQRRVTQSSLIMLLIHDGRTFVPSAAGCYQMLMHMGIVCSPVIMTKTGV